MEEFHNSNSTAEEKWGNQMGGGRTSMFHIAAALGGDTVATGNFVFRRTWKPSKRSDVATVSPVCFCQILSSLRASLSTFSQSDSLTSVQLKIRCSGGNTWPGF